MLPKAREVGWPPTSLSMPGAHLPQTVTADLLAQGVAYPLHHHTCMAAELGQPPSMACVPPVMAEEIRGLSSGVSCGV